MAGKGTSAIAVGMMAGGGLFLWSGFHGASVTGSLRDLLSGHQPAGTAVNPLTGGATAAGGGLGDTTAHSASATANQGIARLLAAPYGWSAGAQWDALVKLWNQESGWDNLAQNPSSGAFGIAQALGHGTAGSAGTHGNQYPSKGANDGDATAQISWGLSYIHQRYGSPAAAWAHEQQAGWY